MVHGPPEDVAYSMVPPVHPVAEIVPGVGGTQTLFVMINAGCNGCGFIVIAIVAVVAQRPVEGIKV